MRDTAKRLAQEVNRASDTVAVWWCDTCEDLAGHSCTQPWAGHEIRPRWAECAEEPTP